MHGSRSKIPSKNLVRQRCAEGFNSGIEGLILMFSKPTLDDDWMLILSHRYFIVFLLCLIPSDLSHHSPHVPLSLPLLLIVLSLLFLLLPLHCSCTARFRPRAVKVWGPKTVAPKFWKFPTDVMVLAARVVIWSKFQTEAPEILGATLQNLLSLATWVPRFVDPRRYHTWALGLGSAKQCWYLYDFLSYWCDEHFSACPQQSTDCTSQSC
jgi:hypothetical protein